MFLIELEGFQKDDNDERHLRVTLEYSIIAYK
jgi:hypothetical protein